MPLQSHLFPFVSGPGFHSTSEFCKTSTIVIDEHRDFINNENTSYARYIAKVLLAMRIMISKHIYFLTCLI